MMELLKSSLVIRWFLKNSSATSRETPEKTPQEIRWKPEELAQELERLAQEAKRIRERKIKKEARKVDVIGRGEED